MIFPTLGSNFRRRLLGLFVPPQGPDPAQNVAQTHSLAQSIARIGPMATRLVDICRFLSPPVVCCVGRRKGTYNFWVHKMFQTFPPGEKRKMSTNRVAIGPIRAILCAQKAMFLGYILGRFRALGRPKKSPKIAAKSFEKKGLGFYGPFSGPPGSGTGPKI